jgi:hypothetical protein
LRVRRIALVAMWKMYWRGPSRRQRDQSGFCGIFSVVLQIGRWLGWAWQTHQVREKRKVLRLSEMASPLSLIPLSFVAVLRKGQAGQGPLSLLLGSSLSGAAWPQSPNIVFLVTPSRLSPAHRVAIEQLGGPGGGPRPC